MYITALDIGSSKIKVIVAELGNELSIIEVARFPSKGVKRGEVVDASELASALSPIFNELKFVHKDIFKNVFVNIGGKNIKMQSSRGIVAVSRADNEIYQDDIDRVIKASQAINLPPNRKIIHTIIQEYIIDGHEQNQSPLGMSGTRLEVNSIIVDAFTPVIHDLIKGIELAGGSINEDKLIYSPLASANAVLTKTHKELGVVLVDIGFGTTNVAIFEENKLLSAKVFPVGASNITNDLAIALKCSIETAENIKLKYGHAYSREILARDKINLNEIDKNSREIVSKKFIADIIESRLAEIFELVHNELKSLGKTQLPAGVILCGGGAKTKGIVELAKHELKLPIHLANCEVGGFNLVSKMANTDMDDLELANVLGLVTYGGSRFEIEEGMRNWLSDKKGFMGKILKNLLP